MSHREREHLEAELDSLLRRERPKPDASWVCGLEERLLPPQPRGDALCRRPHLRLGMAMAAVFAAFLFALSLAGAGPLGGDDADVRAEENCRMVPVAVVESVPSIREGTSGAPEVVYRRELVQRYQRRCD